MLTCDIAGLLQQKPILEIHKVLSKHHIKYFPDLKNGIVRLYFEDSLIGRFIDKIRATGKDADDFIKTLAQQNPVYLSLIEDLQDNQGVKTYSMRQLMEYIGATYMDRGVIRDLEQYLEQKEISHTPLILNTEAPVRLWISGQGYPAANILEACQDVSLEGDKKLRNLTEI